jgi:hypothetical protein
LCVGAAAPHGVFPEARERALCMRLHCGCGGKLVRNTHGNATIEPCINISESLLCKRPFAAPNRALVSNKAAARKDALNSIVRNFQPFKSARNLKGSETGKLDFEKVIIVMRLYNGVTTINIRLKE